MKKLISSQKFNYLDFIKGPFIKEISYLMNERLKDENDNIIDEKPKYRYHVFILIGVAIETLGSAFDNFDWFKRRESKTRFNNALKYLPSLQKYQGKNLYENYRCGMCHVYLPKNGLHINSNIEGDIHLKDMNGELGISIENLFEDFKKACYELIDMINKKNKLIGKKIYISDFLSINQYIDEK